MKISAALSMGRVQRFARPPLGETPLDFFGVAISPQTVLILGATMISRRHMVDLLTNHARAGPSGFGGHLPIMRSW